MKITVFGEILWDIFDDGKKIGGAPLNFAAHSKKLGAEPEIVSAVGNDELGDEVIEIVKGFGLSTSSVARLDKYPTGRCLVTLNNGTPTYNIVKDVAPDNIPMPGESCLTADMFYFGTLAQRDEHSRNTLNRILADGKFNDVFFDINIRQNYYNDEIIDNSLKHTTVFKISREEIGVLKLDGTLEEQSKAIAAEYPNLKLVIITLDKDGAFVLDTRSGEIIYAPTPKSAVVSTVGGGDSFSACFCVNYLMGKALKECINCASALSDFVVTKLEAVPDYPEELLSKIK